MSKRKSSLLHDVFTGQGALPIAAVLALVLGLTTSAFGGSIFVTGHDSDFHALQGPNAPGAQHVIQDALTFVRDGNAAPILFIETSTANNSLGDHVDSEAGLIASGYSAGSGPGNNYVRVSASQFLSANFSLYSAIFIPSDHGGSLTGDDLQAVESRTSDIIAYLNAGGGLLALAEDGFRTPATAGPQPGAFGFLPFLVTSAPLTEFENGNTLTALGASMGLTGGDINGNFSHNVFTATGGMTPVDLDAGEEILSLAFRGKISVHGVPDGGSTLLFLTASGGLLVLCRRVFAHT